MVDLSIIIITLNEEKFLGNLLESIRKQGYKDYEIIVSDAFSKDKTRDIAKSYECCIVNGGGYSSGRNNGAKVANGNYLLFLDADSEIPADFIDKNLNKFKESGKGVGTVNVLPMSNNIFDRAFFGIYNMFQKITSKIFPHSSGTGIFCMKDTFNKINGFNEKVLFAENHEFIKRGSKYGFIILPVPIFTSVRRIEREGRIKFVLKYIYAGLYRIFYKEIKKEIFEYDNKR